MDLVFYLLLNLLHIFDNLCCLVKQHCFAICLTIKHYVYSCKAFQNYLILENSGDNLASKIPKHISILIGLEEISIADMVKLIEWCAATRIPYISFYDHKGRLQKNYPFIKKKLEQQTSCILSDTQWLFNSNKMDNNTEINEISSPEFNHNVDSDATSRIENKSIKIQILSYLDGKSRIVSLTKQLSTCLKLKEIHEKDITSQLISDKLNWNVQVPDPDLAIVFGKTMCSFGFLPWHSRITEFFIVPAHCGILVDDLTRILMKYSKCQQHYGK